MGTWRWRRWEGVQRLAQRCTNNAGRRWGSPRCFRSGSGNNHHRWDEEGARQDCWVNVRALQEEEVFKHLCLDDPNTGSPESCLPALIQESTGKLHSSLYCHPTESIPPCPPSLISAPCEVPIPLVSLLRSPNPTAKGRQGFPFLHQARAL